MARSPSLSSSRERHDLIDGKTVDQVEELVGDSGLGMGQGFGADPSASGWRRVRDALRILVVAPSAEVRAVLRSLSRSS